MAKIFISYSRVDLQFVRDLYDVLQHMRPNDSIWYDKAPHSLLGGDNWWEQIMSAIAECDIFLYVLTNESVQSKYCQAEFEEARRLQKRIITIQARDRTKLTDELSDIQYVDMKHGVDDAQAVASLSGTIHRQLELVKKRVRPLWKPQTPKPDEDEIPTRSPDAPEVETPTLEVPQAEREAPHAQVWYTNPTVLVGLFLLAAAVITGVFGLWQGVFANNGADGAGPVATEVVDMGTTPPPTTPDRFTEIITLASNFSGGNTDWTPQVWTFADDPAGAEMVAVPVGSFEMGSTENEITIAVELCNAARQDGDTCTRSSFDDEAPNGDNTQTFTEPFWIDRTEVTRAQYEQCVDAGVCEETPDSDFSLEPNQPINRVTWFQAQTYCEWRGGSLPTEAEWEYAARGPERWLFPWGDTFNGDEANHCDSNCANGFGSDYTSQNPTNDDGYEISSPVGSYEEGQSWVGAYDMAGNVWEWTSSPYEAYPYNLDHENNSDINSRRVKRGGGSDNTSPILRSAYRNGGFPVYSHFSNGFRCARS